MGDGWPANRLACLLWILLHKASEKGVWLPPPALAVQCDDRQAVRSGGDFNSHTRHRPPSIPEHQNTEREACFCCRLLFPLLRIGWYPVFVKRCWGLVSCLTGINLHPFVLGCQQQQCVRCRVNSTPRVSGHRLTLTSTLRLR